MHARRKEGEDNGAEWKCARRKANRDAHARVGVIRARIHTASIARHRARAVHMHLTMLVRSVMWVECDVKRGSVLEATDDRLRRKLLHHIG